MTVRERFMLSIRLQRAEHQRLYSIRLRPGSGWEVVLEEDRRVTRHDYYRDWHRVERANDAFRREVNDLTASGWEVVPQN